jgi:hypothetical protein
MERRRPQNNETAQQRPAEKEIPTIHEVTRRFIIQEVSWRRTASQFARRCWPFTNDSPFGTIPKAGRQPLKEAANATLTSEEPAASQVPPFPGGTGQLRSRKRKNR